jgi:RHS repeat-associated protein
VATDVKGNITTLPVNLRPAGSTTAMNLTWDSDNKLRSADIDANGTADVNFQYDALGRRVARSGTGGSVVYVQMDQQTIADYPVGGAATTPTFRYVFASYTDEPVVRKTAGTGGTLVYFHRNHQYSISAVTISTGSIAERYAYTVYGQPTILDASASVLSSSAINNRYTYTGREWDATLGLHHFRARWMSPCAGRFLSRDPIGYVGSRWGLYEYVNSKVLKFVDPTGLSSWWDWYYNGNGRYRDLSEDPAIYDAWSSSSITQSALRAFKSSLRSSVSCGECNMTSYVSFSKPYPVDYAPGNYSVWDILFPIGNTTLLGRGQCTVSTTCTEKKIGEEYTDCNKTASYYKRTKCCSGTCQGILQLSDWFVDARDVMDWEDGDQEFTGGTRYGFGARIKFSFPIPKSCDTEDFYDPYN